MFSGFVELKFKIQYTFYDTFDKCPYSKKYDEKCILRKSYFCEAQGKGRARGGPRKVTQRSFMDGGWWMVDILSLELYTKVGCHPPTQTFNLT